MTTKAQIINKAYQHLGIYGAGDTESNINISTKGDVLKGALQELQIYGVQTTAPTSQTIDNKGEIVTAAYEELRISGLTVDPSSDDTALALARLEEMMREFYYQKNLNISFNFSESPTTAQATNVSRDFWTLIVYNLAVRLCAAFGKQIPESLQRNADNSLLSSRPVVTDTTTLLNRLEAMMWELLYQNNLRISYNFQSSPAIGNATDVSMSFYNLIVKNFAIRIWNIFSRDPIPESLMQHAQILLNNGIATVPYDQSYALAELEAMMDEFFTEWNLNVGYNFEVTPAVASQTNVPNTYTNMMGTNLAVRIAPMMKREISQQVALQASQSLSNAISIYASQHLRQVQPPRRMPTGSGNTFRGPFWANRYMEPDDLPPPVAATNSIQQGESYDYYEDFSAWLGSATISSFTIDSDPLLTVDASANATPRITYTITANTNDTGEGAWQQVQITVTDSLGRIQIRTINFQVETPPEIE